LEDAAFLDNPVYEPPVDSEAAADPEWHVMVVRYDPRRRPIILRAASAAGGLAEAMMEEMAEHFGSAALHLTSVRDHVMSCRRIIDIEIDPVGITDDGWEACDHMEHCLASRLGGLVYVPGEGIYDANLQRILKRPRLSSTGAEPA